MDLALKVKKSKRVFYQNLWLRLKLLLRNVHKRFQTLPFDAGLWQKHRNSNQTKCLDRTLWGVGLFSSSCFPRKGRGGSGYVPSYRAGTERQTSPPDGRVESAPWCILGCWREEFEGLLQVLVSHLTRLSSVNQEATDLKQHLELCLRQESC